ncbi:hypothetical protein I350_02897 [Cryptococcus amylolentus CBS 6273]|uniref:Spindle pole body component n=1 Tax=Cryptococcus amylolentus CBS 6273 TaxID=1296118 RepID=A0A1E3K9V6_9TREE|nr:hypothetical protein I350_02897 [Cryptococcus amylolentus CBS 6273]
MPDQAPHPSLETLTESLILAILPDLEPPSSPYYKRVHDTLLSRTLSQIKSDTLGGARKVWPEVSQSLHGLAEAARIRVHEDLADGYEKAVNDLQGRFRQFRQGWGEDAPVRMDNLPQHIHLLLALSEKPATLTLDFAHQYIHRTPVTGPTPDQLYYQQIMDENPYDPGESYDEEVIHGWTDSDSESDPSLSDAENSPREEEIRTPSSSASKTQKKKKNEEASAEDAQEAYARARDIVRELKNGYWSNQESVQKMPQGIHGWRQLCTATNAASISASIDLPASDKVIKPSQLHRELLYALSGRPGIVLNFDAQGECQVIAGHPQVLMLTPGGLSGILNTFRQHATQASRIRLFISRSLMPGISENQVSKTQQAFAEASRDIMEGFASWLADLETAFTKGVPKISGLPSTAATPLQLQRDLERLYASLLQHLSAFLPHSHSPTLLLNLMYTTITNLQQTNDTKHLPALRRLFLRSAEPSWRMIGRWLQHGMPVPLALADPEQVALSTLSLDDGERKLDPEFFIERDRDVSWADEDFWECGFVVGDEGWPAWIGDETGEMLLEAGKARGLLKTLSDSRDMTMADQWLSFEDVLSLPDGKASDEKNVDILEKIGEYLQPICELARLHLRRVLDEECGLELHLEAIEGVLFAKAVDVLHDWTDVLFQKVHQGETWTDFQVLTSSIRTAIEDRKASWLNPMAIRITTARSQGVYRGPRAIESLRADYFVPFPLSQLFFTPTSIGLRSEVFTFILQLSMGRWSLVQTQQLDRDIVSTRLAGGSDQDAWALWSMRQKIAWLLNTLYAWVTEHVIEGQSVGYRARLEEMTSLKSMVALELEHVRKVRDYCFLNPASADLQEAIQTVLELSTSLSDCFASYTLQKTPHSTPQNVTKRRRARPMQRDASSDEEDHFQSVDGDGNRVGEIPLTEGSIAMRLKRMGGELEQCVNALKEGVERLSMEREGDVWSILSFELDSWKTSSVE